MIGARRAAWIAAALAAVASLAGCGVESHVVRVYDGRIVEGAYVPPEAYAAYLRGVLAEEAGDLRSALAAYELAVREDDEDPEPFTRIGDVQCRLDPKARAADDAFGRALALDAAYAPALAARARCLAARGRPGDGVAVVEQAHPADRTSVSMEALFVKLAAQRPEAEAYGARGPSVAVARERAIALTLGSGEHVAAWDALVAWGRGKSDGELFARGLEGLVRVAPMRSREVEAGALELLGNGHLGLARRVAAAVADVPAERGVHRVHDPTVARLAVDHALLAADRALATRRATRGHLPLPEVAARALLLERADVAESLARDVAGADPRSACAAMTLATLAARAGRPLVPAATGPAPARANATATAAAAAGVVERPAAACVLVFAERLAVASGAETAREWVASVGSGPLAPHDPLTGEIAVDLAARGVVAERALPLELRLELAARRREAPPAIGPGGHRDLEAGLVATPTTPRDEVDAKHTLLYHVMVDPQGAPAKALLLRLGAAADRDPIVGFALARAALVSGVPVGSGTENATWAPVRRALAAAPAHPLLLAAAVEIAKRAGRAEDARPARARLLAVARTPAERALAGE